jgi:hypothetical protein
LGEHGTQNWVGEIKFSDALLKQSVPIWELRDFVEQVQKDRGWEKFKPTETYSSYKMKEAGEYLRGDIFVGGSRSWKLVRDYFENEGPVEHPYPEVGIDFAFIAFTNEILPKGEEVEFRGEIEDEIGKVFEKNRSGGTLGGATGTKNAYIDLLLYDGAESVKHVLQVLKKHSLPKGTSINYFTQDKAKDVIHL